MEPNYIAIFDNTLNATYIYVSDSVFDVLGFTPEEMLGKGGYSLIHPDELDSAHLIHRANVMNERMSVMLTYRTLHKSGEYVEIDTVVNYCTDVVVCTNFLHGNRTTVQHKIRASSVDEWFVISPDGSVHLVGSWQDNQARLNKVLTVGNQWIKNRVAHQQEQRFSMILNKFTDALDIVFISRLAEPLVGAPARLTVGQSLYMFVKESDLESVEVQINLAKSNSRIVRLRFEWIVDRIRGVTATVEAVVSCTNDGLVMVVRLAPLVSVEDSFIKQQQKELQA
ncbi:hypothetical protein J3Q64DRAFT_1770097 [Phycomyces blakesleeanus]